MDFCCGDREPDCGRGDETMRFHIIEDAYTITLKSGVYRQVDLFQNGSEDIFARCGSGFIKLMYRGNTSTPPATVDVRRATQGH